MNIRVGLFTKQVRFTRFLAVGIATGATQLGLLGLLGKELGSGIAFTIAYMSSILVHYFLNRFWALPSDRMDTKRQFTEYLMTVLLSYMLSLLGVQVLHRLFSVNLVLSALLAAVPTAIIVFIILNFRVFRKHSSS